MGVPAKHYLPLAEAFAARGIAVALHEWRGIGSSDRRAGRRHDWGYRELLEADLPAGLELARWQFGGARPWLGGHSLGGQLSCLYASLQPGQLEGLALIASGAPYWRCFSRGRWIRAAYLLASPLARLIGHLPGRRLGFGGNEARGVIRDWSRSGRTGLYSADGMPVDFSRQLASVPLPIFALRLCNDWLAPAASLDWLLDQMPQASKQVGGVTPEQLDGLRADHFGWMKTPDALVTQLIEWMDREIAARPVRAGQA
ncbi:hypothetical protein GCM10007863_07040 [Dyella mobilis]|nr:hypothetical protein GCM10007863_07040 [Dyella mobilis]